MDHDRWLHVYTMKRGPWPKVLTLCNGCIFMMRIVLKHGKLWDFIARIFGIPGLTFERLVMGYMNMLENQNLHNFCKEGRSCVQHVRALKS